MLYSDVGIDIYVYHRGTHLYLAHRLRRVESTGFLSKSVLENIMQSLAGKEIGNYTYAAIKNCTYFFIYFFFDQKGKGTIYRYSKQQYSMACTRGGGGVVWFSGTVERFEQQLHFFN